MHLKRGFLSAKCLSHVTQRRKIESKDTWRTHALKQKFTRILTISS